MIKNTINKLILALFVGVSGFFTYSIIKLGVFSIKYTIPAIIIILILFLLIYYGLRSQKKKTLITSRVVALVLSIVLLVVSTMSLRGSTFISDLFNSNYEEHVISFVVLKDRDEESFEDIKDLRFSANILSDPNMVSKLPDLVMKKFESNLDVTYFEGYSEVITRLYENKDDVFILAEAQREIVKELYPSFDEDTKVIDTVSYRVSTETDETDKDMSNQVFSIFVTGIDTFGPVSTVSRSDVNMIVTVNPVTKQILLTNLPRDTQVELASFGKLDKLTHAGIYGVNESITTLENFLDINIDYYLKVNFNSIIDIVDAMGGVDVYSEFEFQNRDFKVNGGMNHFNGEEALVFARARYNLPDMDNDRILNHQALMTGILNKVTSPSVITKFDKILNAVEGSFELSMSEDMFKKLLKNQLDEGTEWQVVTNAIKGEEIWSETTYSMPGHNLYLVDIYPEELIRSKSLFLQIYSDNLIIE